MCSKCDNPDHVDLGIDIQAEMEKLETRLGQLTDLYEVKNKLTAKDQRFADDLINGQYGYMQRGSLSDKQWGWVETLLSRVKGLEPVYGNFKSAMVMFRIVAAGNDKDAGLKKPRVRLMSDGGTFVQLTFNPERADDAIEVHIDGWQGHGYRKFAGWIKEDAIIPYRLDRMTEDVRNCIQDFALNPAQAAKAASLRLGVCTFCGSRLTTTESKAVGYGPTCATRYGLPWGNREAA